jgi:hypothetical protein
MIKILLPFLVLTVIASLTNAQNDVNKMLKDINGKVDEIVIKSEGKTFTFSGDEAEKLFTSMKEDKKMKHFEFINKDGKEFHRDTLHEKIIIKKLGDDLDDDKDILVFVDESDSDNADMKKIEKKVIVSNENGKKVVKVTINEDGKENIEIFEGKAADEYLDKMKSDDHCKIKINDSGCCDKKHKKIIIEKEVEKE